MFQISSITLKTPSSKWLDLGSLQWNFTSTSHNIQCVRLLGQLLELPSRKLWSLMSLSFLWHPKVEELLFHFHTRITWKNVWIFSLLTQHRAFFTILVFDTRTSKWWTTIMSHFEMGLWSDERFIITILFPCFALKHTAITAHVDNQNS